MACSNGTVVEQSTHNPMFMGLTPTTTGTEGRNFKKIWDNIVVLELSQGVPCHSSNLAI